jgi:hypothetical protein
VIPKGSIINIKYKLVAIFISKNSNKKLRQYISAMINMRFFLEFYSCEKIQEKGLKNFV